VPTDPPLCDRRIGIGTGVENHLLHIGEDGFHRVVVGIAFGQTRPANPQGSQLPACSSALDRMGRVPIQSQSQLPLAVTAADLLEETADIPGTLAGIEAPQPPPGVKGYPESYSFRKF